MSTLCGKGFTRRASFSLVRIRQMCEDRLEVARWFAGRAQLARSARRDALRMDQTIAVRVQTQSGAYSQFVVYRSFLDRLKHLVTL